MSFLLLFNHAAAAVGAAGIFYTACVSLTVLFSLLAPRSGLRNDARETLKILLRHKP